jgi:NTP pyrophosphatase (non-canonical NTP hydrolase)
MELNSELDRLSAEVERLLKYDEVQQELERAEKKHPNFPVDMFRQLAIMNEEAGEVTKAVLHYHYEGGTLYDIREELIQTAAMCMRMIASLPKEGE